MRASNRPSECEAHSITAISFQLAAKVVSVIPSSRGGGNLPPRALRGVVGWRGISASAIQTLTPDTCHLYNPNRLWEEVKSDALLRERRVTRARIAAKREVA